MLKHLHLFSLFILSTSLISLADVALSGIVKSSTGTVLSGTTVSLVNIKNLSASTGSDGTFSIVSSGVRHVVTSTGKTDWRLKDSDLFLSGLPIGNHTDVALYSLQGRLRFSAGIDHPDNLTRVIHLPGDLRGMMILSLTNSIGSLSAPVTILGDRYTARRTLQENRRSTATTAHRTSTAIDTLIAAKNGYITARIPLTSYTQNNLSIILTPDTSALPKKGLTIYFIRHAETVANASGETGGGGPVEDHDTLTALGERQSVALKNYLVQENITPDMVIVSPSLRTQKTIEPFLIATGLTGEIWVELNECCGEEPTGEPLPSVRPETKWKMKIGLISDRFTFRTADDSYFWWPQTYEEGLFMVKTAHTRLLDKFSQGGKTLIIVGHAVNAGVLLGLLRGYDMLTTKPERQVYLMNTGIHKLTQDTATGVFTIKQNINKPATE